MFEIGLDMVSDLLVWGRVAQEYIAKLALLRRRPVQGLWWPGPLTHSRRRPG